MGVIICAAAGQAFNTCGMKGPVFPGNSSHTICVAGCYDDINGYKKPEEGFYGTEVDITTPGWDLTVARSLSMRPGLPKYVIDNKATGTSFSTALTAGACALWLAYHNQEWLIKKYGRPFLLDVFRYCLENSCIKPSGWDTNNRGMGILDVKALLECPLPSVSTAETVARRNNWNEIDWGESKDWGRE